LTPSKVGEALLIVHYGHVNELTRITEGLLAELSEVLADWKTSVPDMSQNFPDWYMYAHVHNVRDLVSSIFLLRQEGKIGPMRVLIRVCLESHFNFAAALQLPEFPKNKVHSELRNQKKRIGQWRELKLADQASYLDSVEAQTDHMIQLFTDKVGAATDNSKWDTMAVAEASKSKGYYRSAYFTYSHCRGRSSRSGPAEPPPSRDRQTGE
jgi:hypothetical protein